MIGTHADVILADAAVKGVLSASELTRAAEACWKNATVPGDPGGNFGRKGLDAYRKLGFVPMDEVEHASSRTMDFAYNDYAVAVLLKAAGARSETESQELMSRALHYENTFDESTGFMRGRLKDGSFPAKFDEFEWGGAYIEGSAWQCGWAVPHDAAGLAKLMGGRQALIDRLDRMMTLPPIFSVGSYGCEIHEMTEMAKAPPGFGQYAHSNQPVHHALYLYAAVGAPSHTQYWVRRVCAEMYGLENFPGDEDNGEMSAWFVLSSMGIFPLCPGHPSYVLGSPMFSKVTIRCPGGGSSPLTISAAGEDGVPGGGPYVAEVFLDGKSLDGRLYFNHTELLRGGELRFVTTPDASRVPKVRDPASLPFSLSLDRGRIQDFL